MADYNQALLRFIEEHPTSYHVIDGQKKQLAAAGYTELSEQDAWELAPGGKYYVTRNASAIAAFRIPGQPDGGFRIAASHSDSPGFRIKENPEIRIEQAYTKLNVEPYGGMLMATWLDRPLSIAGRIFLRTEDGLRQQLIKFERDLMVIPNLAIHMNREANKGYEWNAQRDLLPLYGTQKAPSLKELLAAEAGVSAAEIVDHDLFLYCRQKGVVFGANGEYLLSPHLDDVQCAFSSLQGFLESEQEDAKKERKPAEAESASGAAAFVHSGADIPVHLVFDNEEVGSATRQGAASTFLADTLERISLSLQENRAQYLQRIAKSFLLSADNAHAVHPNHPEKTDPGNRPVLNGGVVLKFSANQKYTTDGQSAAIVRLLAGRAGVSLQEFHNRSDQPGGSTLGNLSIRQVAACSADIGIAQLAMHSAVETCGAEDTAQMIGLLRCFFSDKE